MAYGAAREEKRTSEWENSLVRRMAELSGLHRVISAANSTLDLDTSMQIVVETVAEVVGVEACSVYLYDKNSDDLTLRAGLRYTRDEKDFTAFRTQSPIGAGALAPIHVSPSDTDVSWDLSAVYALNDAVNVYGRVARGFRAPSIQGRLLFGNTVSVADSETSLSIEAGIKADLFEQRARLGFAVFDYTVDDLQLTAVGGAANFNTLINAAEANGQGFELDLEALLTDRLSVTVGASYNDTEINDPGLAIQPCGGGCTVLDPAGASAGLAGWARRGGRSDMARHASAVMVSRQRSSGSVRMRAAQASCSPASFSR